MNKQKRISMIVLLLLAFLAGRPVTVAAGSIPATIRFAVIGDFGSASASENNVANLVKSWAPDLIVTAGDNNYPGGSAATIDANIGQYYHDYIFPYTGAYGAGAASNKFFPTLGNHDWVAANARPYLDYFSLPGNERYYDFVRGPVHFFMLDSDSHEPDGNSASSKQALWLKNGLSASTTPWQIVLLHHSPYSSATHGSIAAVQWDYQGWGADAVISGHDHTYERIVRNGFPYFVNGLGGYTIYPFNTPVTGSVVRYNDDFGAMLVTATDTQVTFQFWSLPAPTKIDEYTLLKTTFSDVPGDYWAWPWIESIYNAGITGGCLTNPLNFCPEGSVTRAQMAVFLLKGIHGSTYIPPAANGTTFGDVAANYWAAAWVEQLANEGITSGCGGGYFCPEAPVTRAQMSVLLLRSKHGTAYTPPGASGVFNDVPNSYWAASWVEQLANEGITSGCGGGNYCPDANVTRAQMSVFLVKTFNLP